MKPYECPGCGADLRQPKSLFFRARVDRDGFGRMVDWDGTGIASMVGMDTWAPRLTKHDKPEADSEVIYYVQCVACGYDIEGQS